MSPKADPGVTQRLARRIRDMRDGGMVATEIGDVLHCSARTVQRVLARDEKRIWAEAKTAQVELDEVLERLK